MSEDVIEVDQEEFDQLFPYRAVREGDPCPICDGDGALAVGNWITGGFGIQHGQTACPFCRGYRTVTRRTRRLWNNLDGYDQHFWLEINMEDDGE